MAVVSWSRGRLTVTPSWSAWSWSRRSMTAAPPSTRSALTSHAGGAGHGLHDVTGLVRHRFDHGAGQVGAGRCPG